MSANPKSIALGRSDTAISIWYPTLPALKNILSSPSADASTVTLIGRLRHSGEQPPCT